MLLTASDVVALYLMYISPLARDPVIEISDHQQCLSMAE